MRHIHAFLSIFALVHRPGAASSILLCGTPPQTIDEADAQEKFEKIHRANAREMFIHRFSIELCFTFALHQSSTSTSHVHIFADVFHLPLSSCEASHPFASLC